MVRSKLRYAMEILALFGLVLGCSKQAAAGSWSFQYEQGKPTKNTEVRDHAVSFEELTGRVFIYATFAMMPENPSDPRIP